MMTKQDKNTVVVPKAILLYFRGSGSERVRSVLEQVTGKVGLTRSVVEDLGLDAILPGGMKRPTPASEGVVVTKIAGWTFQDSGHAKLETELLLSVEKRIILVRHPLDMLWTRYQRTQTGSHTMSIRKKDFHPIHFALQAKKWVQDYLKGKVMKYIYMYHNLHLLVQEQKIF